MQAGVGTTVERNTLSNALAQRDLAQMVEAWLLVLQTYRPWIARMGKKFARLAVIDSTLIKLSLEAFAWAEYRAQSGAAKLHAVLEWACSIPQQMVVTTGKVADLRGAQQFTWAAHWTYVFDRAYLGFDFLTGLLEAGAHFVVRPEARGQLSRAGTLRGGGRTSERWSAVAQRLDGELARLGGGGLAPG